VVFTVANGAESNAPCSLYSCSVDARQGVGEFGDEQEDFYASVTAPSVANLDIYPGYDATAIPGMLFSSPNSAELIFTENLSSMANGVSRPL
jgi:hypothetical protein